MTKKTAKGKIVVKTYQAAAYQTGDGPALNQLDVTETFTGDVQADGVARMLQAQRTDGSASFVAMERVTGTIGGKQGSFLLQDQGSVEGNRVKGTWFGIAGSGTGGLGGLRGEGSFEAELGQGADYQIDYWFE